MISTKKNCERIKTTSIDEKVRLLNNLLVEWTGQFDKTPHISFSFSVNEQNILTLVGIPMCHIDDIDPETSDISFEYISIGARNPEHYFSIHLVWDYSEVVQIKNISYILYQNENI